MCVRLFSCIISACMWYYCDSRTFNLAQSIIYPSHSPGWRHAIIRVSLVQRLFSERAVLVCVNVSTMVNKLSVDEDNMN